MIFFSSSSYFIFPLSVLFDKPLWLYCGLILTDTLLRAIKKKARCPMSEEKRPNYTKEFKQNAIKLVIE